MPRYEYRAIKPTPEAEKRYLAWIDRLDREFRNPSPGHRSEVVREELSQLYLGRPYAENPSAATAAQVAMYGFSA